MNTPSVLTAFDYSQLSGSEFIILSISSVLLMLCSVIGLTKPFHMLQQSSYFNLRYIEWLKTAPKVRMVWCFVVFAVLTVCLCYDLWSYIPVLAVSVLLFIFRLITTVVEQKKAIKPLVFTGRVKRMFFTAALLTALLIVIMFVNNKAVVTVIFISSILVFILPIYAMLINLINRPFEKAVARHFINDAKRVLKKHSGIKTIGITGSYGKTSTKFIIGRILSEKYNVTVTPENFNTTMGVVRTIREKLQPQTEIFVCEMGAKKKGDIREICNIVNPSMGVITSIGPQHLNTFKNIDNIVKTKFELADSVFSCAETMLLNVENKYISVKAADYSESIVGYGISCGDYRVENISASSSGSSFDVVFKEGRLSLTTKLLGRHNILNIVAGVAIGKAFGVTDEQIKFAVSSLEPVEHRLELKKYISGCLLIDDAYNSNPDGCLEAVNVLKSFDGFKKVIITPGLVELGAKEYECNFNLGKAAGTVCDEMYFVGLKRSEPLVLGAKESLAEDDKIFVCESFKDALGKLSPKLDKNTVVLIENDLPDNYLN